VESKLGPLGTSATEWPILLAPGDCDDGEFRGITIVMESKMPVTVAEQSKACTVFARSEPVIVGSNSTQGMDV
jgi:hypothetical protein